MEYIGLIIEIIMLLGGVYLYLFSTGRIKSGNPQAQERGEKFRRENKSWLRILSLALVAIMLVNVVLHIRDLIN